MKFCKECGHQLNDEALFCPECGTANHALAANQTQAGAQQAAAGTDPKYGSEVSNKPAAMKPKSSFKLSKGAKIWGSVILVIALLLFGSYKVGDSLTAKDKVIDSFKQAVAEKDKATLMELISSSDPRLVVNEDRIDSFLKYMDKNPSYFSRLMDSINDQSKTLDQLEKRKDDKALKEYHYTGDSFVALKKQGKKWLIYDNYTFEVKPYFISVHTNFKGAKIFMDEKEIDTANSEEFSKEYGPFMPGVYKFKAAFEGKYTTLEEELEIEVFEDDYADVDLYLYGEYVTPNANYSDAKLYINGQDSGQLVGDAVDIGPMELDGSVKMMAVKTLPWGEVRSEEAAVTEHYVDLYVEPLNDTVKDELMAAINDFNKGWSDAYNNLDASLMTSLTESQREYYASDIEYMADYGLYYKGDFNKSIFDLDSFELYEYEGQYEAYLDATVMYNSAWYYEGEDSELIVEENILNYYLVYDEITGQWLVSYTSDVGYMDTSNIKEFEF
jgi:uncharacterized membrane protein YvbJ